MDIVSAPGMELHTRVLYDTHGRIALHEIPEEEATTKLVRIEDKTTVKKGRRQLNLHDGRNIVVKEDEYNTGDVLRLKLPEQGIADHFPFQEGAPVYVTGGTHIGQVARIVEHKIIKSSAPNLVRLEGQDSFQTVPSYAFVVGKDEPAIAIPEVETHA